MVMEQSTGGIRSASTIAKANADPPPQRRMTGRAISSNQEWFRDAMAAEVVLYDATSKMSTFGGAAVDALRHSRCLFRQGGTDGEERRWKLCAHAGHKIEDTHATKRNRELGDGKEGGGGGSQCVIRVEKQREQVAVEGSGAPCVDGVQKPKPGEIANLLHIDMVAHRKKTADFNEGWKRALVFASVGLAIVSMIKAVEKAREGDSDWLERSLTSANAGLIAGWVAKADSQGPSLSFAPSQMAAFVLSGYQLVSWALRHGREHADFPVAVILFVVAMAAISSMHATLNTADNAFKASGALADKVSVRRQR